MDRTKLDIFVEGSDCVKVYTETNGKLKSSFINYETSYFQTLFDLNKAKKEGAIAILKELEKQVDAIVTANLNNYELSPEEEYYKSIKDIEKEIKKRLKELQSTVVDVSNKPLVCSMQGVKE